MQLPYHPIIRHRSSYGALPLDWSKLPHYEDIVFSCEVRVSRQSRLRVKALVFKDGKAMRRFWKVSLERPPLSTDIVAVCGENSTEITYPKEKDKPQRPSEMRVDPRYVCVLGFIEGFLTPEYITHESVHAAYAYDRRVQGKNHWPDNDQPEERICYPAGIIAGQIIRKLHKGGLFRANR
jgi:hypothetical protein